MSEKISLDSSDFVDILKKIIFVRKSIFRQR